MSKGAPAPKFGVLVDEGMYRYYREETKRAQLLESELYLRDEQLRKYESQTDNKVTFLMGIVLGALIYSGVKR